MHYNSRKAMTSLNTILDGVNNQDKHFIGTITFKSEDLALPNGSKMALGIDDGHWVLIVQHAAASDMKVFQYDQHEQKIIVDQKTGNEKDVAEFKDQLRYFFQHAHSE
jgi:hypothetical protein